MGLSWEPPAQTMLKEESLASFYVGCLPAVVSTAASGALFYGIYDLLKERYFRYITGATS